MWLPKMSVYARFSTPSKYLRSETHTASILLQRGVVKTLLHRKRARPRLVLRAILVLEYLVGLLFNIGLVRQFGILGERNSTHYIGKRPKYRIEGGGYIGGEPLLVAALGVSRKELMS
jgi:hypothetical protein